MKKRLIFGIVVYIGTSQYFLRHPELLHIKKNKLKLPPVELPFYVIPHRGGSMENPENTL
jgi:glycerophosphoryl diester phosphodiesterase